MRKHNGYSHIKLTLLIITTTMLALWIGLHANTFFATQNGFIRAVLSILFAILILLRPKPASKLEKKNSLVSPFVAKHLQNQSTRPSSQPPETRDQRSANQQTRNKKSENRNSEILKKREHTTSNIRHQTSIILTIITGILCTATGIIFTIHQLEWIGILMLTFASLRWILPTKFSRDIPLSLFVLYWANPLPNQIFSQLQIWMQIASVKGSELLLHIINVRVWSDGLILRTDVYTFEVPAWCSGMRIATTVFILSIALGILRRMRWHKTALFTLWSLFHALLLNILRISIMVVFSQQIHSISGLDFLHNTAAIVVIAGVMVVYIEMIYLEHRKQRQDHLKSEINQAHFENISEYPPFWKRIIKHRKNLIMITAATALIVTIAYRVRPYHRAMMIKDVATALRDQGDLKSARRAAQAVTKLIPENLEWQLVVARLHIICGQHDLALTKLESIHDIPEQYLTTKRVLMAYALMCTGRIQQASEIVALLPQDVRENDPRIAMIMAEMALQNNDSDAVAIAVVVASGWSPNAGRIRNLYPYLHIHRQWEAMADSAMDIPYSDPVQAFSILEAYMNLGQVPEVANITKQVVIYWPNDMRALEPLYFMAIKRGTTKWENMFSKHLLRSIQSCNNPDMLFETMYKTFALSRPDLAWAIYWRIHKIDANHPTLYMSLAKYGHKWFAFRKRSIGIPSAKTDTTFDLRPFFILGHNLPKWKTLTTKIPHGKELSVANTTNIRKQFLKKAIKAFENRQPLPSTATSDQQPLNMQYLYARALEMGSRIDLAKQQLESIAQKHPKEKERSRIMLSEIYERKGDWINVYENLRTYLEPRDNGDLSLKNLSPITLSWPPANLPMIADDRINLKPLLRLIKAQLHLKFRIAALHTARNAVRLYPYSSQAIELLAQTYLELGKDESALHLLAAPRPRKLRKLDILEAQALFKTERYNEVSTLCRRAMLPPWHIPPGTTQNSSLPPAELSLLWHRTSIPSEAQFETNAKQVRNNLANASTGLRKLLRLWLQAYNQHCAGNLADPETWIKCGRDPIERAIALNQLTFLLCREERYIEAKNAAQKAVASLPSEPLLWQILISLSDNPPETISYARKACPNAPELWLAELVQNTHPYGRLASRPSPDQKPPPPSPQLISEAIDKNFPPAIITRAAEYLWRNNMRPEATLLARNITERARGLLPAYIISMQCALYANDTTWALASTEKAIQSALQPLPEFYKNFVTLKVADGDISTEPDMVNALRNLRRSDPDNPKWAQMLGYIRFQRGGWEIVDAMVQMQSAINNGSTNQMPYIIASEASRLLQNYDRAADILRQGLKHHPHNQALINNLAFTLSYSPKQIDSTIAMIPTLKKMAQNNPKIKDTLVVVYLKTGNLDSAQKTLIEIMKTAEPGSPIWFRSKTHLAEIAIKQGKKRDAAAILKGLLKNLKEIPDEDIMAVNAILSQISEEK